MRESGDAVFQGVQGLERSFRLFVREEESERRRSVDNEGHRSDAPARVDEVLGRFTLGQGEL
jgi:hypothetical protein